MSNKIIIPKRTDEEILAFFRKNQWRIRLFLGVTAVDSYQDTTPMEDASVVEVPLESYREDSEDDAIVSGGGEEE
ncbi:MAG: hypothetical protein GY810_06985 [Aureispira sp.]|nr:hypothetical protein [Aureispira sp.]